MRTHGSSREQIAEEVKEAIKSCLEASGRRMPMLRGDQRPLTSISGFDSLCAIEVTVDLQERLAVRLEGNVFVKAVGGKSEPRTLDEVVDDLFDEAN